MKKVFQVVFVNIFLLFILYFVCEYACFCYELYRAKPYCAYEDISLIEYIRRSNPAFLNNICVDFDKNYMTLKFRPVSGEIYTERPPVLLFGCSFAYGAGLNENQTFSYKLSKYSKRKVYNRAYSGWGIQNMLYQVRRQDFYDLIKEEPEIVLYTFMNSHTSRIYSEMWGFEIQTFYKKYKNSLIESVFRSGNFIYGYTARQIRRFIANTKYETPEAEKFAIAHFIESKKEMQKHWKNTKYVIFVYSCTDFDRKYLNNLKNYGFDVIFYDELTNENLQSLEYVISEYDGHPNEKAWDLLIKPLIKKLNL